VTRFEERRPKSRRQAKRPGPTCLAIAAPPILVSRTPARSAVVDGGELQLQWLVEHPMANPGEVTAMLAEIGRGQSEALPRLVPLVYQELKRLAAHFLQDERPGHTLQPTALVNEAYLRLAGQKADWRNRAHFMAVAGHVMRRVLVDYARQRVAGKRGGGEMALDLDQCEIGGAVGPSEELLAVDEALTRLAALDAQQARVVELRYFGGMSVEETAQALAISPRTVKREWAMAKAWLRLEISGQ
jgi:RNA polymerase sigma factor (TIGR02999 family)